MDTDEIEKESDVASLRNVEASPMSLMKTLCAIGIIIFVLIVLFLNLSCKSAEAYRAEAIMNAGQIGKTLFSFEQEYESYPNDETARRISLAKDLGVFDLGSPGSSNYYFRQLIVTGFLDQEIPFHARYQNEQRPDNVMDGRHLLEAGECSFSYVVWESSENLHEKAPMVMTPLIPGKRQFDYELAKKYYNGGVIILHRDTSVRAYLLDSSGRVMIDGKDFFDPSQPYWGGQKPRIAWPE